MKIVRPMTINDAALTACNVSETTPAAWSAATTYNLNDLVNVVGANSHHTYQSLQGTNLNHAPGGTSNTWWLDLGATNRWLMFDGSVTSQTSNANSVTMTIAASGRTDTVALLNISAASVNVIMTDSIDGVVYNNTRSMISDSGISDWYAYFFEPIIRSSDAIFDDLPPYANATLNISATDTGNTVLVGCVVVGQSRDIGGTQYGATVGIADYSVKTQDAFGNWTILPRSFHKISTINIAVDNTLIDELETILASYRAEPILYIGSDIYKCTAIYGFYKTFGITISYPTFSICNIQLEGLN